MGKHDGFSTGWGLSALSEGIIRDILGLNEAVGEIEIL